jgi:hypothetical protein
VEIIEYEPAKPGDPPVGEDRPYIAVSVAPASAFRSSGPGLLDVQETSRENDSAMMLRRQMRVVLQRLEACGTDCMGAGAKVGPIGICRGT